MDGFHPTAAADQPADSDDTAELHGKSVTTDHVPDSSDVSDSVAANGLLYSAIIYRRKTSDTRELQHDEL